MYQFSNAIMILTDLFYNVIVVLLHWEIAKLIYGISS